MEAKHHIIHIDSGDPDSVAIAIRGIQTVILVSEIGSQCAKIGSNALKKDHLKRLIQSETEVKDATQKWIFHDGRATLQSRNLRKPAGVCERYEGLL
ncbi:hypothetical protein BGZ99_007287 [Dissophora globulifera]|uniref:Uncharacterized protein n=1 Tax=Dissophora globulifera TaxID=979702 RepID=A0A9P6RA33_9FUNG|nr:hypothetical protein BGZ99_007287 [Dissophora globulifera]